MDQGCNLFQSACLADDLVRNATEGYSLTGKTNENDIIDTLLKRCPSGRVLLAIGEKGSIYSDTAQRIRQPAFHTAMVDTTWAGDTWIGFVVQPVLSHKTIKDTLRIASMAASMTVRRVGAGRSIPHAAK